MGRGSGAPVTHHFLHSFCFFFLASLLAATLMVPAKRFSAAEKGKARQEGPGSPPPKRGRGRSRKHAASPAMAPRGSGGAPRMAGVALVVALPLMK